MSRDFTTTPRNHYEALKQTRALLTKIDGLITELKRVEPYGDLIENFGDQGSLQRLFQLVDKDLEAMKPHRENAVRATCSRGHDHWISRKAADDLVERGVYREIGEGKIQFSNASCELTIDAEQRARGSR